MADTIDPCAPKGRCLISCYYKTAKVSQLATSTLITSQRDTVSASEVNRSGTDAEVISCRLHWDQKTVLIREVASFWVSDFILRRCVWRDC